MPPDANCAEPKAACKPSSVPCRSPVYIPTNRDLLPVLRSGGGHLSSLDVAVEVKQPTRGRAGLPPPPIWPRSGWGLPCPRYCYRGGELLPRHFTLIPTGRDGVFSAALSVGSPRPAVSGHPARWSSDFPPPRQVGAATARRPWACPILAQCRSPDTNVQVPRLLWKVHLTGRCALTPPALSRRLSPPLGSRNRR